MILRLGSREPLPPFGGRSARETLVNEAPYGEHASSQRISGAVQVFYMGAVLLGSPKVNYRGIWAQLVLPKLTNFRAWVTASWFTCPSSKRLRAICDVHQPWATNHWISGTSCTSSHRRTFAVAGLSPHICSHPYYGSASRPVFCCWSARTAGTESLLTHVGIFEKGSSVHTCTAINKVADVRLAG